MKSRNQTEQKEQARFYKALGRMLKAARKKRKLSQAQLSAQSGIPVGQISKYELFQARIPVSKLFNLIRVLGMDPTEIYNVLKTRDSRSNTDQYHSDLTLSETEKK